MLDGGKKRVLVEEFGGEQVIQCGRVGGGIREFLSTVCTCKTEEVYIHGGNDGLISVIFT